MPIGPSRSCSGVGPRRGGCSNLVSGKSRFCEECEELRTEEDKKYEKMRNRRGDRKFIRSRAWGKIRVMKLARDPLCERCFGLGDVTAAYLVHHIDGDEFNNAPGNHESLCNACHEIRHKGERFVRRIHG